MAKAEEKRVIGVRLADLIRDTLVERAQQNGRSLSGEIVYRLRKSLEAEDEQKQQA